MEPQRFTQAEWLAEGKRRFGDDPMAWRFECPVCKHAASMGEFRAAGADPQLAYQECIGRHTSGRDAFGEETGSPCNYAGYGLFRLSPVRVITPDGKEHHAFAFAGGTNGTDEEAPVAS